MVLQAKDEFFFSLMAQQLAWLIFCVSPPQPKPDLQQKVPETDKQYSNNHYKTNNIQQHTEYCFLYKHFIPTFKTLYSSTVGTTVYIQPNIIILGEQNSKYKKIVFLIIWLQYVIVYFSSLIFIPLIHLFNIPFVDIKN